MQSLTVSQMQSLTVSQMQSLTVSQVHKSAFHPQIPIFPQN
jgi:hypothetical protein